MHLVERQEATRLDAERRRHAGAVFRDMGGVVLRAGAAVEAGIEAPGHAAGAGEKSMADAGQGQRLRLKLHNAPSNPGIAPNRGAAIAIALNNSPMPRAPSAIRRARATSISAAWSGGALALSAEARCTMPRRRNRSRWRIGPWIRAPMLSAHCVKASKSTCAV